MSAARTADEDAHETGDYVDLDRDGGDPMLLVHPGTPDDDLWRLIERLEELNYGVTLEYKGDHQRAYCIHHDGFGGDRDGE